MRASSRPDRILLISDLHLAEARPELTQAFVSFLACEAANCSALYILGDLFNLWIGDDDDRPLNTQIAAALKQQADAGLHIFLIHGNRDFLLGENFAARAGATLLQDPCLLKHGSRHYVLLHGDQLCTQDTDYQTFRTMVRNAQWQQQFLAQPLAERRAFADKARTTSQSMNSNKADDIMDVTPSEVSQQFSKHGVSLMIHGHTHRPAVHEHAVEGKTCTRIVLGDWGTQGWFVELVSDRFALQQFPIT